MLVLGCRGAHVTTGHSEGRGQQQAPGTLLPCEYLHLLIVMCYLATGLPATKDPESRARGHRFAEVRKPWRLRSRSAPLRQSA